jgi:hypothetical protein
VEKRLNISLSHCMRRRNCAGRRTEIDAEHTADRLRWKTRRVFAAAAKALGQRTRAGAELS